MNQRALDIDKHLLAAQAMLEKEGAEDTDVNACIWRLLEEAATTDRALPQDGPKHQALHGVDYHHTDKEIWEAELGMAADNIQHEPDVRVLPTPAALERYDEVMSWLLWVGGRRPRERQAMILNLAHGKTLQWCADVYGFGSRAGVRAAKFRAIEQIRYELDQLRRAVAV